MSKEKADEFSGWAGKLEEQGALEGLGLELADKEAGWDKLYVRMGGVRRRRPVWYWVAAASVIMLAVAVALLIDGHGVSGSPDIDIPVAKPAAASFREIKPEVMESRPGPVSVETAEVAGVKALVVERPARRVNASALAGMKPSVDTNMQVRAVEVSPTLLATGPATPIAPKASPFNNNLKVISINEIQSYDQDRQLTEQKQQRSKFRIQFGNPGSFRPAMATSQRAEQSGVFIKLSSQNP